MTETKEQLVHAVKKWIDLDNEIREISKTTREKREEKKQVSVKLMEMMKNNDLDCLDINDGKICYKKSKSKKPLNKENLLKILQQYFKSTDKSIDAAEFILNNREVVDKETLTRKINK